ncbi:MAG TPA: NlpC/P60 family protein [Polyangiales bacterium]|nr:NlpC/P60 family protein [Polyangiales bacterium]
MVLTRKPSLGRVLLAAGVLFAQLDCASTPEATRDRAQNGAGATASCPARTKAPAVLPGVQPEEQTLAYWLKRYTPAQLDQVLMDDASIAAYNLRVGRRPGRDSFSQRDLRVPLDPLVLQAELRERLGSLRPDVSSGKLLNPNSQALGEAELAAFSETPAAFTPRLHVVLEPTTMRCGPYPGALYRPDGVASYDKNACGPLRAQEVVELLGKWNNGMFLARTRSAFGWVPGDAKLSPAVPPAQRNAWLAAPRVRAAEPVQLAAAGGFQLDVSEHTLLPKRDSRTLLVAAADRFRELPRPAAMQETVRPLTRRALLQEAFGYLDTAYGLGGAQGGRDCSGLLVDVFESFDIALPRFSGWQADAGSYAIDLSGASEAEKLRRLERAAQSGVVLLYFPGHIMLYLGKNAAGTPMALHALGEYAQPCAEGRETIVDVQRTVVSDFELGRGSSRKSFLERMTRLVVIGGEPPAELANTVVPGPTSPPRIPAGNACRDGEADMFISPANPAAGQPLRVIATSARSPGGATLWVFDSDGQSQPMDELRLGGPPFARVARTLRAQGGSYTAVLGSDQKVLGCKRFRVRDSQPPAARNTEPKGLVWEPKNEWDRETEALWAVFVEQLFAGAPDDEQTWTNLHSLLRDPSRNLLYDHLGLKEEDKLEIEPDCADLPYSLRAYFSWKLRLPYGYRQCSRGRTGQPPSCGELRTSLTPRNEGADDVDAFEFFVNRGVRSGVHSATGRTAPTDPDTDLYPVALERDALPPGTVYADPYGHVMMISKWFDQGQVSGDRYGVLIAAEAQPDGTIGRRRFWQGSFLFDPSTENVGAGFKRFRPLKYDKATQSVSALDNDALRKPRDAAPFSLQQYKGTRDDFYERMDELINPTPLTPEERLHSLVAAFDEAVRRRVLSVDNGEHYAKEHPTVVINMPKGHDVFETEGAWEDFATPSRDMRLLIALDTVNALPERVLARPERFQLPSGMQPKAAADALRKALAKELSSRTFEYTRSDGQRQSLTLADVAARADALEVAYNPNDCAELRWGAPADSAELKSCTRRAPTQQRERMQSYRTWFHERKRPARD